LVKSLSRGQENSPQGSGIIPVPTFQGRKGKDPPISGMTLEGKRKSGVSKGGGGGKERKRKQLSPSTIDKVSIASSVLYRNRRQIRRTGSKKRRGVFRLQYLFLDTLMGGAW